MHGAQLIGERIRSARVRRRLTQREVAREVGLSPMAISKYETGKMTPSSAVLVKLARATRVNSGYFIRPANVTVKEVMFRNHPSAGPRDREVAREAIQEWVERYAEVEALLGASTPEPLKPLTVTPLVSADDAERGAEELRSRWNLGTGPVPSMVEVLEARGIRVGTPELPEAVHAMVVKDSDGRPAIALRRGLPGDRQRFSLAHELAHLVLPVGEHADSECLAHRFAAAFLVPAASARQDLGGSRRELSPLELFTLKHKWGMSMQAWIKRARELQILQEAVAGEYLAAFKKRGWREREPGAQIEPEAPRRMELMAVRAVEEGIISEARAGELLGTAWEQFVACRFKKQGLPVAISA